MTAEAQVSEAAATFLDRALPPGASTLLLSPMGPEKEALLLPLIRRALHEDAPVLLALSHIPPRRVLRKLSLLGEDVDQRRAEGRLRILDWHTHKEEEVGEEGEDGGIVRCPGDPARLEAVLRKMLKAGDGSGLAVVEVLTDFVALPGSPPPAFVTTVAKDLQGWKTSIFVADTDFLSLGMADHLWELFDGVLEVTRQRTQERVTWMATLPRKGEEMQLYALEMKPPYLAFVPREAKDPQVALPAEKGEAGPSSCPQCGAPLEGSECDVCGYMPGDPDLSHIKDILTKTEEKLTATPEDMDALFTKAAAQARLKAYDEALQTLNELTRMDPTYPGMWMLKAKLFDQVGDELKANLCRHRALELAQQESGRAFEARVYEENQQFRCPLCNRVLPMEATICPCGAEFEEE